MLTPACFGFLCGAQPLHFCPRQAGGGGGGGGVGSPPTLPLRGFGAEAQLDL